MSNAKELIEKYSNEAKIATNNDKIHKDECVYSFNTSELGDGLFVCLKTFVGVSRAHLPTHFRKTQSHLYLNIKTVRKEIINDKDMAEPEKKKPTKFGIGIEGGFDLNEKQFTIEHSYGLFIWPDDKLLPLPDNDGLLNDHLRKSIDSVIKAESISYKEELAAQAQAWDGEQRFITKHSQSLVQLPNPRHIPPTGWKCDKCDLTQNLWLNLTDGKILCGRKQLDGSGGNNHAVEHYQQTRYPLTVKLGTITSDGKADVYSYDEDDMVEDTNLIVHLAHFGINVKNMQKTEKTMAELEIDLNQKFSEWDVIQEAGSKLTPLYGPGFTGLRNLGNSCYMNSVMQVLFNIPEFQEKYFKNYEKYVNGANGLDPTQDFNLQMAKLAYGLLSGLYSKDPNESGLNPLIPKGIKPQTIKSLIGKGHPEFSTKRQQDAQEYFAHLMTLIDRSCHQERDAKNPADIFKFEVEDRIQCLQTKHVNYVKRVECCLSLPVSLDLATNSDEVKAYEKRKLEATQKGEKLEPSDICRPKIPLIECLKLFLKPEAIAGFFSEETGQHGEALKSQAFATFPDYLVIHMKKFQLGQDWTPMKLDVALDVPDVLDINQYRSSGIKTGEVEMKKGGGGGGGGGAKAEEVKLNEEILNQLLDMGFSLEGSKRAVYNTREVNQLEAAVNWCVAHMEDNDFNQPFQIPTNKPASASSKQEFNANEESVASIISFGFTRAQAIRALKETNNNLERAADWIFSHADELMDVDESASASAGAASAQPAATGTRCNDGNGKYELIAFISHMGTNANVGHYVAHIKKNGKWCLFNDQNVSTSEHPPKELAYLYLYRRI